MNFPTYVFSTSLLRQYERIAKDIHKKVEADSKPPTDNQNCLLCTWCFEANARGINVLPRPVYSPRDTIFKVDPTSIVLKPVKEKFSSRKDLMEKVSKNENSRYYVHVKWSANSGGGHEFIVANIPEGIYVVDPQDGKVLDIDSHAGAKYLDGISYAHSYMLRLDDKQINVQALRKENDEHNVIEWEDKIDMPYVKKHKMA